MAARPIPEQAQRLIVTLHKQGKSRREIRDHLKRRGFEVSESTVSNYVNGQQNKSPTPNAVGEVGMPVDSRGKDGGETSIVTPDRPRTVEEMAELFGVDLEEWELEDLRTNEWQGFYKLKTAEGHRKVALFQTRASWRRKVPLDVQQGIQDFVAKHVGPIKINRVRTRYVKPYVVSWGLWDTHLGMYAWAKETGQSYDLNIAVNRVLNSIDDMVEELKVYPISKIWMPIGNDFMHFDNAQQMTTRAGHQLDTDTRFAKVYEACLFCLAYMIERALEIADSVEGIYVPGNHDKIAAYTLCVALKQRYRNTPGVSIDAGPNPRKYRSHGGTLLGFDHGELGPERLALIMPTEAREQFSSATYTEFQVGHTHQRREKVFPTLTPNNGVIVRTNPSLCGTDAWHHGQGFIGEPMRSVEAYRYDQTGFRGSHVTWARDDKNPRASKLLG